MSNQPATEFPPGFKEGLMLTLLEGLRLEHHGDVTWVKKLHPCAAARTQATVEMRSD